MTNEEAFERLFDISIEQLREMPQEEMMEWKKETNRILWGGFNGGNAPTEEIEK